MALKAMRGSPLAERNGFDEDDDFQNSPLGLESCGKDSCSMGSGGGGRRKENEKDTRTTESEDNVAAVPQQRCLLVFCNVMNKIRKRTDTAVA